MAYQCFTAIESYVESSTTIGRRSCIFLQGLLSLSCRVDPSSLRPSVLLWMLVAICLLPEFLCMAYCIHRVPSRRSSQTLVEDDEGFVQWPILCRSWSNPLLAEELSFHLCLILSTNLRNRLHNDLTIWGFLDRGSMRYLWVFLGRDSMILIETFHVFKLIQKD